MKDDARDLLPRGSGPLFYTLDEQRRPQPGGSDVIAWARWLEAERAKPGGGLWRVADTLLPGRFRVSTIFMGLDHSFRADGPPILFETMAFYPTGRRPHDVWAKLTGRRQLLFRRGARMTRDIVQLRYASWDEAAAGHASVVQAVRRLHVRLQAAYAAGDEFAKTRLHQQAEALAEQRP